MEKAQRTLLERGKTYRLNGQTVSLYKCIRPVTDHPYSVYGAYLQNIKSGWTFYAEGTNIYADGSIDWDYSHGGQFMYVGSLARP